MGLEQQFAQHSALNNAAARRYRVCAKLKQTLDPSLLNHKPQTPTPPNLKPEAQQTQTTREVFGLVDGQSFLALLGRVANH